MINSNEVLTKLPTDKGGLKIFSPDARINLEDFFLHFSIKQADILEIRSNPNIKIDVVRFANKEIVTRINDTFITEGIKVGDTPIYIRPIYECNVPTDQDGHVLNRLFIPYVPDRIHQVDLKNIFKEYGEIYSMTYAPPIALVDLESVAATTVAMNTENKRKRISERKIHYAKYKNIEKDLVFDPEKIIVKLNKEEIYMSDQMIKQEFKSFGNIHAFFRRSNFAIISFEKLEMAYRALNEYDGNFEIHACIIKRPPKL